MTWAAGLLLDRERAPIQPVRVPVFALMFTDTCQIFERRGNERMIWTKRLGPVVYDLGEQSFGFAVAALDIIDDGELALHFGNIGMVWTENLLQDVERSL